MLLYSYTYVVDSPIVGLLMNRLASVDAWYYLLFNVIHLLVLLIPNSQDNYIFERLL